MHSASLESIFRNRLRLQKSKFTDESSRNYLINAQAADTLEHGLNEWSAQFESWSSAWQSEIRDFSFEKVRKAAWDAHREGCRAHREVEHERQLASGAGEQASLRSLDAMRGDSCLPDYSDCLQDPPSLLSPPEQDDLPSPPSPLSSGSSEYDGPGLTISGRTKSLVKRVPSLLWPRHRPQQAEAESDGESIGSDAVVAYYAADFFAAEYATNSFSADPEANI